MKKGLVAHKKKTVVGPVVGPVVFIYLLFFTTLIITLAPDEGYDDDEGRLVEWKVHGAKPLPSKAEVVSEEFKVVQEFLNACIPQFSYITLPNHADPDVPIMACQLLSQRTKLINVPTYAIKQGKGQIVWNVQPFEILHGSDLAGNPLPGKLDIFKTFHPTDIDILGMLRDPVKDCDQFRVWKKVDTDVEGCVGLHAPAPLEFSGSLTSPAAPVLAILNKLREDGFVGQHKLINHRPRGTGKFFDSRGNLYSKKAYYQCVLVQRELFQKNMLTMIASNKTQAYYKLILKDPRDSHATLPPSACKAKALTDGMPSIVDYVQPALLKALPRGVDGDSDDDETLAEILKRLGPARARPDDDEDAGAIVDGSNDESSQSKAESEKAPLPIADPIDGSDDDGLEQWPDSIEGVKLGPPSCGPPTY